VSTERQNKGKNFLFSLNMMLVHLIFFGIKALIFPELLFSRDFNYFAHQLLPKLTFNLLIFNYRVILNFLSENKSVVI
jgi:hypothetical protein